MDRAEILKRLRTAEKALVRIVDEGVNLDGFQRRADFAETHDEITDLYGKIVALRVRMIHG